MKLFCFGRKSIFYSDIHKETKKYVYNTKMYAKRSVYNIYTLRDDIKNNIEKIKAEWF